MIPVHTPTVVMDMGGKTHEAAGRTRGGSSGGSSVDDLLRNRELLERERKLAEREQSLLDRERNANRHRGSGVKGTGSNVLTENELSDSLSLTASQ